MVHIFSCGSNGDGQLGLGDNIDRHGIVEVQLPAEVASGSGGDLRIVCGGHHTLLVDRGRLYGCGQNDRGQLLASKSRLPLFEGLEIDGVDADAVSAGWEFSIVAVAEGRRVLASGYGPNGELGLGKGVKESTAKTIEGLQGVVKVKSSIHSTIAQLEDGTLVGWGNNKKGQLFDHGGDREKKTVWSPTPIDLGCKVFDFALGRDFTVFVTANGIVLRGRDNFQIGQGLARDGPALALEGGGGGGGGGLAAVSVQTMWSSVHLVTGTGIVSIGNNSHGQLFPATWQPGDIYTVGSEHGLVVRDGSVYAWGWGEHGNCGEHDSDSVVYDELNPLYKNPYKNPGELSVPTAFAGCATSFIVLS